jgi:hypothetical protein
LDARVGRFFSEKRKGETTEQSGGVPDDWHEGRQVEEETRASTVTAASTFVSNKLRLRLGGKGNCGVNFPCSRLVRFDERRTQFILESQSGFIQSKGAAAGELDPNSSQPLSERLPRSCFCQYLRTDVDSGPAQSAGTALLYALSCIRSGLMKSTAASICPDRLRAVDISCPAISQVSPQLRKIPLKSPKSVRTPLTCILQNESPGLFRKATL